MQFKINSVEQLVVYLVYLERPILSIEPEIPTQVIRANFLEFCFSRSKYNFFIFLFTYKL